MRDDLRQPAPHPRAPSTLFAACYTAIHLNQNFGQSRLEDRRNLWMTGRDNRANGCGIKTAQIARLLHNTTFFTRDHHIVAQFGRIMGIVGDTPARLDRQHRRTLVGKRF